MKTSGAGKGGVLAAVAGVVAIGVAGCGTGTNSATGKTDTVGPAAAGVGTTSPATTTTGSPASPAGAATTPATSPTSPTSVTAPTSPTSVTSVTSSPNAAPSTTDLAPAPSTSPASRVGDAATSPNAADPASPSTSKTFTPRPGAPTPKYTPPPPKPPTGTGWLVGVPHGSNTPGPMDPRCMTGRVICVDMSTRTLLWVVDGKPQYGMDVRFGDENNPTRKGKFSLYMKMKDCISTIYHTPMPDAMFFSGGEAVHFSIDFKTYGYAHHSHGCVNVRDRAAVDRLFADTRVGDTVVVY